VSWLNDPEVVRFSELRHSRHTLDSCRAYFENMVQHSNLFLSIVSSEPQLGHIGNISVTIDHPNRVAEMAILLGDRKAWGMGLGREAWSIVMQWLLTDAGFRKVTAGTMAVNRPMLAVMMKTGMRVECLRSGQFLLEGQAVDLVLAAKYAK